MNRHFLSFALILSLFATTAKAQFVKLDKYPLIPIEFESAFVDQVTTHVANGVKSLYGHYFGQLSPQGNIYGFGSYYTELDGEVYGLYRNGDLAFGIKKGGETAKVGTNEHYVCYDLRTGYPMYVMKNNTRYSLSPEMREDNRFMVLSYPNGDKYVGETTKDNQRDGYGLYFYASGDFYYGRYRANKQYGYGALFSPEHNRVTIQFWDGITDNFGE